jgi:parallel beta-helix repeat protein
MKRKWVAIGIILLFLGTGIIPVTAQNVEKSQSNTMGSTIYVDDDNIEGPWDGTLEHPFRFIKDGVIAAHSNDTVYVFRGFYTEGWIKIWDYIHLIGENRDGTFVDGIGNDEAFLLCGDHSTIEGFTITNSGGKRGLIIWAGNYNTVRGNRFVNNPIGIWVVIDSEHNILCDNIIANNSKIGMSLYDAKYNLIENNHFENNYINLQLEQPNMDITNLESPCFNRIIKNNFLRAGSRNTYYDSARLNIWSQNYWENHIVGPKIIFGIIRIPIEYPLHIVYEKIIHTIQVDWHPVQEPYDIPGMR